MNEIIESINMKFNLQKDLAFFDIESTGLNVIRDRIVQLAVVKYKPNGEILEKEWLINPGIPIAKEAFEVHGISSQDVANKPTFKQLADEIHSFMRDCDWAGYNSNRFDIPMLLEEFYRAGITIEMDSIKTIDVQRIFYKMEPRTLSAAYRFYCGKNMENAHDALADVKATAEVLMGQLDRYAQTDLIDKDGNVIELPVKNDMKVLHDFTNDFNTLDATQRLKLNDQGVVVFNFGKYMHQAVGEVMYNDRNYYHWILDKEFSFQVKSIVQKEFKAYEATRK